MVTIRTPFCGYNTPQYVQFNVEDLSCYSNKIESLSLIKRPYDHWHTNKACLSAITDIFIFGCQRAWELLKPRYINLHITLHYITSQWQTFLRVLPARWRQKSTGIDVKQNYVTVTLCIRGMYAADLGIVDGLSSAAPWQNGGGDRGRDDAALIRCMARISSRLHLRAALSASSGHQLLMLLLRRLLLLLKPHNERLHHHLTCPIIQQYAHLHQYSWEEQDSKVRQKH